MSKNLKKRSKGYKPKQLDNNAHFKALVMARPLSETVKQKFLTDIVVAIVAMTRGGGAIQHFHTLATMIEISAIFIKGVFYEKSYEPALVEAKNGLFRSKQRYESSNVFGLDGPAIQAIKECQEIFKDVLDNITGTDLANAIDIINKNLREKNFYTPDMMAA